MSFQRKLSANWRNAQRSTGPRTIQGKARSKLNSWQHGLSLKLDSNSAMGLQVEQLAAALAGPNPDPARLHFAVIAADAEIDLLRGRAVRQTLTTSLTTVSDRSAAGSDTPQIDSRALTDLLRRLDRYERRAFSRRNRAMQLL